MPRCSACDHESPAGARFCMHCASPLAQSCGGCGADLPAEARFCPQCARPVAGAGAAPAPPERSPRDYTPKHLADRILGSKSALEGERKQVTVLFADLKGSMDLAEELDPEAWHQILERFFEILTEGVHRFEGTVNQYTGDGIMALFGAPIAHEDHAQRACYAALALRDSLRTWSDELRIERGIGASVRMGINSGEVVVGKIGDDLRMDYTAQGHTVGLAQRMEQLAEARAICVSDRTAKLVEDWFELRDLGASTVKGVSEPVRVFELEGVGEARTRLDTSRARGFSKFVGRAQEFAELEAAFERARSDQGEVIGIVADAGTGKSRLCHEFMELCRARGVLVRHAYGVAHGKAIPLLPVLDLLRQVFGIGPRDSDREARQKIAGAVVLVDETLREDLPLLFDFLGVPDPQRPPPSLGPEARQRRVLELVRRFSLARGRQEPAVLVFEDLHWIDPGSEAFVEAIVSASDSSRSLVVLNFRPEYRAGWMRRSNYRQTALRPLDTAAIEEMLGEWLGADASLRGLSARICERTGGTPFFVEEVVQSLVESGALEGVRGSYRLVGSLSSIEIPVTVQALLAARIDRLGESEKRVLQTAAVIGKEFDRSLLARVMELDDAELDAALYALVQSEFIYEQALYPEVEYAFKHPLTQEVSMGSQLRERRARVHEAVAKAFEELHAEQLDEKAALLAHHWEEAGDPVAAAEWHLRAARWMGGRDSASSVSHMLAARALTDGTPESEQSMRLGLEARARVLGFVGRSRAAAERYEELAQEGDEIARRLGDERSRALLIQNKLYASIQLSNVSIDEGELAEALEIAERFGDLDLRVALLATRSFGLVFGERASMEEGVRICDEAIALAGGRRRAGFEVMGIHPLILVWLLKFSAESMRGHREEALRSIEQALDLARELDDFVVEAPGHALAIHPFGYEDLFSPEECTRHAERAAELCDRLGTAISGVFRYWALGVAHERNARSKEAVECFERSLQIGEEEGMAFFCRALCFAELANSQLLLDPKRARGAIDRALSLRARSWDTPRIDLVDARVRIACGEPEAAAAAIERGRARMRATEAPSWTSEFDRLAAELAS